MGEDIRLLFPIFEKEPGWVYLDSAATAHKPRAVIEALSQFYREEYATVHRAIYQKSLLATEKYFATRLAAQRFLGASRVEEIIFTRGTTDGINLVASSFREILGPEDEMIVSEIEHHSNLVPWQIVAEKTGAKILWAKVDDRGVLDLEGFKALLSPKTKLVALAHMSNVTGTIHPIREITELAHSVGAKVLVDGAQAAAHIPIDVQKLDVDFYVFSGHKCYGPTGVGILYGKYQHLEEMAPLQGGGDMVDQVFLDRTTYQPPPLKFEAGTPLIGPVIALKPALDLLMELGLEKIAAWEEKLYETTKHALIETIPKFRILGSSPQKGPLLTFSIEGVHPLDLATLLDLKNISIRSGHLCAQTALRRFSLTSAARASFGIYNTLEDVERFVSAVQSIVCSL